MKVDDSTQTCLDLVRRFDSERCLCAMFAPPGKRAALMALLAFNVEIARIPELVSEPLLGQMRVQWWRQTLDDIRGGTTPDHPVAQSLADAGIGQGADRALLVEILDAREADLMGVPPNDLSALETYAAATGGALNQLMALALGMDGNLAATIARPIGTAWALTGLLRAVPFHQAQGQAYITMPPERVAGVAVDHITQARRTGLRPDRTMMSVLLPAVLAGYHLARLRKSAYDATHSRVHTPGPGRLFRLYLAYLRKRF